MDFTITLAALAVAVALVIGCNYVERRRRRTFNPGLLPMLPFQIIGAVAALMAVMHLFTLMR